MNLVIYLICTEIEATVDGAAVPSLRHAQAEIEVARSTYEIIPVSKCQFRTGLFEGTASHCMSRNVAQICIEHFPSSGFSVWQLILVDRC